MDSYILPPMDTYSVAYLKKTKAQTIKRLLREAGYTQRDVARTHGCSHVVVNRTIRKKDASDPIWRTIARMLSRQKKAEA